MPCIITLLPPIAGASCLVFLEKDATSAEAVLAGDNRRTSVNYKFILMLSFVD
jgi:hypothetical protein